MILPNRHGNERLAMSGYLSFTDMFWCQGRYDVGTDQYNRLSELTSAHDALILDPPLPPKFQDDCVFDPSRNQLTWRACPFMIGPISARRWCFICIFRLHPTACVYIAYQREAGLHDLLVSRGDPRCIFNITPHQQPRLGQVPVARAYSSFLGCDPRSMVFG